MLWLISKYAITAFMVVLISETAKRSDRLGGLLAALPLVTVLVLVWMKLEGQTQEKIAAHAWYTFWYVVPTLPMFILFPFNLLRSYGTALRALGAAAETVWYHSYLGGIGGPFACNG